MKRSRDSRSDHSTATSAAPAERPVRSRSNSTVRVMCVDDHVVLVEGLRALFEVDGSIEIVGRLASASRMVEEAARLQPDVVVLDIEMPGPDAFEMADRLRRQHPEVRVLVLSAHIRDAFISSSFRAGVSGYFAKSDSLEDIVRGIHEVAQGGAGTFLLGPKVRERCRPQLDRALPEGEATGTDGPAAAAPRTLLDTLTPREEEILRLIGKGRSRTQIASELCRSAKTVDAHQSRMMKKLGIEARADLMRFAIREGLAQA